MLKRKMAKEERVTVAAAAGWGRDRRHQAYLTRAPRLGYIFTLHTHARNNTARRRRRRRQSAAAAACVDGVGGGRRRVVGRARDTRVFFFCIIKSMGGSTIIGG